MAWSNQNNTMVLSTGNKSEVAVGYCTLYGDTNGGLNPIGDLYKTEVYRLLRFYAEQGKMPWSVIDKAPSAELFPGQKDEDSLPPYPVLDAFLQLYLENKNNVPAIASNVDGLAIVVFVSASAIEIDPGRSCELAQIKIMGVIEPNTTAIFITCRAV